MQNHADIWDHVDAKREAFTGLSDRVWDMPELNFQETRSSAEHLAMLKAEGFRVSIGLAGIPTAIMGEAGEGGPVIAILGEFDALPGLSQEAGVAEHRPLPGDGNGHACGHNLLGAGAMLAATAVKDWLSAQDIPGRVRYYGCPAEEGGAAKAFMVRDGAFADVDVAISWHPASFAAVRVEASLAVTVLDFTFIGRAAHASAFPHLGRSALDAAELMNSGVNYMREHMTSDARIHYAYLDAGGIAANVVQAKAVLRYVVRAAELSSMRDLVERVKRVAGGAAMMTDTTVTSEIRSAMSNLVGNVPLEQLMFRNLDRLGPPQFDEADVAFAGEIQATVAREDIISTHRDAGIPVTDRPVGDRIVPLEARGAGMIGSTDVGDVSWAVPTVQARGATCAVGTAFHSWQLTAQGKSPLAHKGMVHAAKVMAGTAIDLLADEGLLAAAKADHRSRLADNPYVCPLPPDLKPALAM